MSKKIQLLNIIKFICLIGLSVSLPSFSTQSQSLRQIEKFADECFKNKDYINANKFYHQILEADSSLIDTRYKYAQSLCYLNDYQQAALNLQKVVNSSDLYPTAFFELALMQKQTANYSQAISNFEKFLEKSSSNTNEYYSLKAKKEIESCRFALENTVNQAYKVSNIEAPINSPSSEFSAQTDSKGNLYYSAMMADADNPKNSLSQKVQIYKSQKQLNNYDKPVALDKWINTPDNDNANWSMNEEHRLIFFSRTNNQGFSEIFYSQQKDSSYSEPAKLPELINAPGYNSTQAQLSNYRGKNILLFTSDRPGGFGKLDIWYAPVQINENEGSKTLSFQQALCLNKNINSIDNEISPFYDPKLDTLFFSSDWHNGFGGYDIFKTTGNIDSLHIPLNMGLPINSPSNDYYLSTNSDEKKFSGYFASNRKGSLSNKSETCCNDIYYFESLLIPKNRELSAITDSSKSNKENIKQNTTKSKIIIDENNAPAVQQLNPFLPLSLYFHNDEPNPKSTAVTTKLSYDQAYKNYKSLTATYENEYSKNLNDQKALEAKNDIKAFFNEFVDKGYKNLQDFSQTLQVLLKQGYQIELEVKGFASPLAKSDYNVNLSKRRINSFENYIQKFDNNFFASYLKNKQLIIKQTPNGEYQAGKLVSDNVNDIKNSIFSRSAALERKIEIELRNIRAPEKKEIKKALEPVKQTEIIKTEKAENTAPHVEIKQTSHNFGIINYGEKVSHTFTINNTGSSDLIIYNAIGSCGCTVPEYSKEPVKPGQQAQVVVTFDSKGKFGPNNTSVTLITNAEPKTIRLNIAADVIMKK